MLQRPPGVRAAALGSTRACVGVLVPPCHTPPPAPSPPSAARSWGKYVTQLQMVQFVTMNAQAIYILWNGCPYPAPLTAFYLAYIVSLFALFASFYVQRWSGGAKGGKAAKGKGKPKVL